MVRGLTCFFLLLSMSSAAYAQGVGFVGGGTIDPEQFYAGTFFETPALGTSSIHVRPGIDGSWGDGLRIAAINLDIIHRGDIGSDWQFYTGGGPTVLITRLSDSDLTAAPGVEDVTGGFSALLGFKHSSGFLFEVRYGSARNGPSLKFGAGLQLGKKKQP